MSTALAMILAAGITVPSIGPEKVSGEMKEPRLDLRGEWELTIGKPAGMTFSGAELTRILHIKDEGGGKLRMALPSLRDEEPIPYAGTYHQRGDRVIIDLRIAAKKSPRPGFFLDDLNEVRLVLRRVKPAK